MFEQFYGMSFNPFSKSIQAKYALKTENFQQVNTRLNHLLITGGIGVVCAESGTGKTFTMRSWSETLNRNTHRVIYICMSTLSTAEFYRQLCYELGIEVPFRKIDMFRQIQSRIKQLADEKGMKVVIIIDEAQYLSKSILEDFVMLTNFDMDSRDCFSLILVGLPHLLVAMRSQPCEALRQRIAVNYTFVPLRQEDAESYLTEMLRASGADPNLFEHSAAMAAFASCSGSLRRLGAIATKALMIGAQNQVRTITEEIVVAAVDEETL